MRLACIRVGVCTLTAACHCAVGPLVAMFPGGTAAAPVHPLGAIHLQPLKVKLLAAAHRLHCYLQQAVAGHGMGCQACEPRTGMHDVA